MTEATFPIPPPVPRFPIADANGHPTASFQEWCQIMWAAIQGGGGIVDTGTTTERLFALAYTRPAQTTLTYNVTVTGSSVRGSVSNLLITNGAAPTTQTNITCDEVVLETAGGSIFKATAVSLTTDTGASGLNGIDTGAVAVNTFYSVWIISDGSSVAGLLSTSATSPTLPGGYDFYARVGWVNTLGVLLRNITQRGTQARYTGANIPVMGSGAVGSVTIPTYQTLAVATYVPTTACVIHINVVSNGVNAVLMAAPNSSYGAYNTVSNNPPLVITSNGAAAYDSRMGSFVLESGNIYWASVGANNILTCYGWEDVL